MRVHEKDEGHVKEGSSADEYEAATCKAFRHHVNMISQSPLLLVILKRRAGLLHYQRMDTSIGAGVKAEVKTEAGCKNGDEKR